MDPKTSCVLMDPLVFPPPKTSCVLMGSIKTHECLKFTYLKKATKN
jgi:hypothetical protein